MEPQPHDEATLARLQRAQRVDRVCDRFETVWKVGPRPRIDDFLTEVPPSQWLDLLRELLSLDLEYRRQRGESPTIAEYQAQYPALQLDQFADLFAETGPPSLSEETVAPSPSDAPVPTGGPPRIRYLGDYELLEEIARGGMGVVYKARQVSLNRLVAVKMILAGLLVTKADSDRFHSEAQAAAVLDHPNILPVFEVGEHEGQHYFSMGYVEGQSLATRLDEGPLPPKEAAELVATVAEAVEYAHRQGVIHRDIKPSNILIDSKGRPRVTDFGLAKRVDSGSDLTATGQVLGTPSYMPPEQAAGQIRAVGPAADVYALGALLYATLTGRPPFQAATSLETLRQVIEREPVPLRQLNPAIPRDLETIALKCLEKSVPRRYATAQALVEDLRRYLEGRPILARPVGRWEHAWRWCRRQPVVAGLLLVAVLLVVLVAAVSTIGYVSTSRALKRVEDAQRERALAQVDALRSAEISRVPDLIEGLKPFRAEIVPQLRQLLQQPELGERERLRLSLARVAEDEGQVVYLSDRLLRAEPAEVLVIRDALAPYKDSLLEKLWAVVESPDKGKESRRLQAAAALAKYDPESERWVKVQEAVGNDLVNVQAVYLGTWMESLRTVRTKLFPILSAVYRNTSRSETERSLATDLLAEYAADQPEMLANLLMDADEKQFAVIYPKFKDYGEQELSILTSEVGKELLPVTTDWTVRFYNWQKVGQDKRPADWAAVLKSPVLNELRVSRLSFHGAEELSMNPKRKVPNSCFAVVATSEVTLADGDYVLSTTFADGVRVWLDNAVVFENWATNPPTTRGVTISGQRGRHNIKVECFQIEGGYELDVGLDTTEEAKEALAKRQANAAVALLKMNHAAMVWPLLKHSPDPRARSYLIHRFAPLGADVTALVHRLGEEPDISIRRALILSLGEFDTTQLPMAERQPMIAKLLDLYRIDPDPGLHGAAEWLLRQEGWDQGTKLAEIEAQLQVDEKQLQARKAIDKRQWYVNSERQTFVILNADKSFRMGSPDNEPNRIGNEFPRQQLIGRRFAIAPKIVTKAQFRRFQQANPDVRKLVIEKYSPTDDCPQLAVDWYDAARYCNWLSKIEGIPKEQWCYEPNDQGKYAEGMKPAADYLRRNGYRLPTEAEWEYACRSGAETSRYYGLSVKLSPKYAWFQDNSEDQTWPVGMKKPNDYGLFDMLGNASQWCDNSYKPYAVLEDSGEKTAVRDTGGRVLRGGSFDNLPSHVRSASRVQELPVYHSYDIGIRMARTILPNIPVPAIASLEEKKAKEHQSAWSRQSGMPVETTNSIGMKLALIPPGEFEMGSPKELIEEDLKTATDWYKVCLPSEGPQHRVRIAKPFYLGMHQVTQEEYQRVIGKNPSEFCATGNGRFKVAGQDTMRFPVDNVSWDDAVEFCRRLSEMPEEKAARRRYRLPSEAQWEYACRAESMGRFSFSSCCGGIPKESEENALSGYGWCNFNSGLRTHAVGNKKANAWGLFDMHGNVWEWCEDWYDEDYYAKSPADDPTGPLAGSRHVTRGGCWHDPARCCRSAVRQCGEHDYHGIYTGFRVSVAPADK